ncbi:MAG: diguanylate cyclase, partial [Candidatus Eremiobacteraeota bacterium]|nr:diguanylate cyclase [Candidatus Eremiobacteraeota bacterium]
YVAVVCAQVLVPGGSALVPLVLAVQIGGLGLAAYAAVVRYRNGFTPARYFIWGFFPVAIGITASLTWQLLQPGMDGLWFFAYNGGELGIMLQTIMLSFGVADRLRTLERDVRSMESLAHADALTGVANRISFAKTLDECVDRHGNRSETFAVLFCDLDGFKSVNDRYGHTVGDEVLRIVARRLVAAVRGTDLVARVGGDEFAVVLEHSSLEQAGAVAKAIEGAFEEPIVFGGSTMPIGISIGSAIFPRDGRNAEELLAYADRRMYERKKTRKEPRRSFLARRSS